MPTLKKARIVNFTYGMGGKTTGDLSLEFDDGATTIYADNGLGKSHLIQALMQPISPGAKMRFPVGYLMAQKGATDCFILLEWGLESADISANRLLVGYAMAPDDETDRAKNPKDYGRYTGYKYFRFIRQYGSAGDELDIDTIGLSDMTEDGLVDFMSYDELKSHLERHSVEICTRANRKDIALTAQLREMGISSAAWTKVLELINKDGSSICAWLDSISEPEKLLDGFLLPIICEAADSTLTGDNHNWDGIIDLIADAALEERAMEPTRIELAGMQRMLEEAEKLHDALDETVHLRDALYDCLAGGKTLLVSKRKDNDEARERLQEQISQEDSVRAALTDLEHHHLMSEVLNSDEALERARNELEEAQRAKEEAGTLLERARSGKALAQAAEKKMRFEKVASRVGALETRRGVILGQVEASSELQALAAKVLAGANGESRVQKSLKADAEGRLAETLAALDDARRAHGDAVGRFDEAKGHESRLRGACAQMSQEIAKEAEALDVECNRSLCEDVPYVDVDGARRKEEGDLADAIERLRGLRAEEADARGLRDEAMAGLQDAIRQSRDIEARAAQKTRERERLAQAISQIEVYAENERIWVEPGSLHATAQNVREELAGRKGELRELEEERSDILRRISKIKKGTALVSDAIIEAAAASGVACRTGELYLRSVAERSIEEAKRLADVSPLLAYGLIFPSAEDAKRASRQARKAHIPGIVPLFVEAGIEEPITIEFAFDFDFDTVCRPEKTLEALEENRSTFDARIGAGKARISSLQGMLELTDRAMQTTLGCEPFEALEEIEEEISGCSARLDEQTRRAEDARMRIASLDAQMQEAAAKAEDAATSAQCVREKIRRIEELKGCMEAAGDIAQQADAAAALGAKAQAEMEAAARMCEEDERLIETAKADIARADCELGELEAIAKKAQDYAGGREMPDAGWRGKVESFIELAKQRAEDESEIASIDEQISAAKGQSEELAQDIRLLAAEAGVDGESIAARHVEQDEMTRLTKDINRCKERMQEADGRCTKAERAYGKAGANAENCEKNLISAGFVRIELEQRISRGEYEVRSNTLKGQIAVLAANVEDLRRLSEAAEKSVAALEARFESAVARNADFFSEGDLIVVRGREGRQYACEEEWISDYDETCCEYEKAKKAIGAWRLRTFPGKGVSECVMAAEKELGNICRCVTDSVITEASALENLANVIAGIKDQRACLEGKLDATGVLTRKIGVYAMTFADMLTRNLKRFEASARIDLTGSGTANSIISFPRLRKPEKIDSDPAEQRLIEYVRQIVFTLSANEKLETKGDFVRAADKSVTQRTLISKYQDMGAIEVNGLQIDERGRVSISAWSSATKGSNGQKIFLGAALIMVASLYERRASLTNGAFDSKATLIIDNPFGELSSEPMLAPFYRIAEITKTQTICFTAIENAAVSAHTRKAIHLRTGGAKLGGASLVQNGQSVLEQYCYKSDIIAKTPKLF